MTNIVYIDDDGSVEAYTMLYPLLERFGFKGCFAVVSNRIGKKGYMNSSQLLELQEKGHEIMSHSRTHPNMNTISFPEAVFEFKSSKADLKALGLDVSSFVFPYNQNNPVLSLEVLKMYDFGFVGEEGNGEAGNIARLGVGGRRVRETRKWVDQADDTLFLYGHSSGWNKLIRRQVRKLFKYIAEKGLQVQTAKTILKQ